MRIMFRSMLAAALIVPGAIAELPAEKKKELESRLRRSTTPEIPATVLGLIRATEAASKVETIEAAMEVVALRRPTALPLVVSTIAKAEPELSEAAASAAVQSAPAQASLIERAAVTAAPERADLISQAVGNKGKEKGRGNGGEAPGNSNQGKKADNPKFGNWPDFDDPLPNGKKRPSPPNRPVDPPRPVHYNKPPRPGHPGRPEHPLPERPGNPNPGGKIVRPGPPGGHPVWDR